MKDSAIPENGLTLGAPAFWFPDYLAWSTWTEHVPFAFWLTAAVQPSTFVELGTFRGMSYLAFCQAVKRLGLTTACYAVDTWRGDQHSGSYGDEIFEPLSKYNTETYSEFSTLIQSTFDEAASRFVPHSIDLLHIDGLHTYEAVRHDWEMWQTKLSSRAVVLFHDTAVRDRDFGVWRLWSELSRRYPHFEFLHGCGLGVLGFGSDVPELLRYLFDASAQPSMQSAIRQQFSRLGAGILDRMYHDELKAGVAFRDRQIETLLDRKLQWEQQRTGLEEACESSSRALREASDEKVRLEADLRSAKSSLAELTRAAETLPLEAVKMNSEPLGARERISLAGEQLAELRRASGYLESRLSAESARRSFIEQHARALELSLSWRITRPLREVSSHLPVLARSARAVARPMRQVWRALRGHRPVIAEATPDLIKVVSESRLFDDLFYRKHVQEPLGDRLAAAEHYLRQGAGQGIDPSPIFSGSWYLSRNPDVASEGVNPFVHFLLHGQKQGRDPHPLFDVSWYVGHGRVLNVDRAHALDDFLSGGFREGRNPHPLFDCRWYDESYRDFADKGINPLIDYLTVGAREGRDPHPLFDTCWYLTQNPDVEKSGCNPLIHYVLWGGRELRSPFQGFDPVFVNSYSQVAEGNIETPLALYARTVGRRDFRSAFLEADLSGAIIAAHVAPCTVAVGAVVHANPVPEFIRLARSVQTAEADRDSITLKKLVLSNGPGNYAAAASEHEFAYLHAQENRGFGYAHNVLMRRAFAEGADVYIAANPDGFFHPSCISRLVRASQHFGNACILEAAQFPEEHPKVFNPVTLETPWASGACMVVPRAIFEATGGFDENFFMYCEDVDLSWTALDRGFTVRHVPFALFYHDLTEREGQSWRARQSLLAARYMGHKWGSPQFVQWAEGELRKWGLWDPNEDLPTLPAVRTRREPPPFADFSHRFHFGLARWQ